MTNFIMSEITVNEDFTSIDIPEINLAVSGFANYLNEENALNIFWYTTIENGRFELLESYNNKDFITTVILEDEYSYTYPITTEFDKRYFKIIQTTNDDQTAESPYSMLKKTRTVIPLNLLTATKTVCLILLRNRSVQILIMKIPTATI